MIFRNANVAVYNMAIHWLILWVDPQQSSIGGTAVRNPDSSVDCLPLVTVSLTKWKDPIFKDKDVQT